MSMKVVYKTPTVQKGNPVFVNSLRTIVRVVVRIHEVFRTRLNTRVSGQHTITPIKIVNQTYFSL